MKACPGLRSGIDRSGSLSFAIRGIPSPIRAPIVIPAKAGIQRGGERRPVARRLVPSQGTQRPTKCHRKSGYQPNPHRPASSFSRPHFVILAKARIHALLPRLRNVDRYTSTHVHMEPDQPRHRLAPRCGPESTLSFQGSTACPVPRHPVGIQRPPPYADSSSWQDLIQRSVYSASAEIATLEEARLRRGALWYNSVEYGLFALPANSPATRHRGDIVITGVHALIYSTEAEALRTFFKDILELSSVDAGHGWLLFALPPAELGIHPTDNDVHHELYLSCDDIHATVEKLKGKGV